MPAEAPPPPVRRTAAAAGRIYRWLGVAGVLSAGAVALAARTTDPGLATAGAAAFTLAAVIAVVVTTRSWPRTGGATDGYRAAVPPRESAFLAAIAYVWGAAAMQGAYLTPLTGLKWQHGWQYALAMALLAAGSLVFARAVDHASEDKNALAASGLAKLARLLAVAQALISAGGLAALAISGRLWSERTDWAANRVFAGLAATILVIALTYLFAGRSQQSR